MWANFSNGHHGRDYRSAPAKARTLVFLDRYVKGVSNGFEKRTAHLTLWMESATEKGGDQNVPSWKIALRAAAQAAAPSLLPRRRWAPRDQSPRTVEAPDSYP